MGQVSFSPLFANRVASTADVRVERALSEFGSLNGYFTENRGQVTDGVRFYLPGNPAVAFRDDGVLFLFRDAENDGEGVGLQGKGRDITSDFVQSATTSYAYLLQFEDANPVSPAGKDRLPFNSNFFSGSDSTGWNIGVPNYRQVLYEDLYDGIDLVFSPAREGVKYDFVIHPWADIAKIRLEYQGIDSLRLDARALTMQVGTAEIRDSAPRSFQGSLDEIDCRFDLLGEMAYGFACGPYDRSETLVIDPFVYSTYVGGSGIESGRGIAIDSAGSAYIVGKTESLDFPVTPGAYNTTPGSGIFVAKLNPAGDSLIYATYLHGGAEGRSIAVDSAGDAYVTGEAKASFPVTPNALDTTYNGGFSDAFVTKIDATGSNLIYSTFLGGNSWEYGSSIAVDPGGNATVAGSTESTDFPTTPGVWQRTARFVDAFVSRLDADGNSLIYSTYFGGDLGDLTSGLALDADGNAYVTGTTDSDNVVFFPTGYDRTYNGGGDAYILKLSANASRILYFTYLGGSGSEVGNSIAVDADRNVVLGGVSDSNDFGMGGYHFDPDLTGPSDGFVLKLNITTNRMFYGTFIGGTFSDEVSSIVIDPWGNVLVTGTTQSADFPSTPGSIDTAPNGMKDAFVMRLNATQGALMYSSYLGGAVDDSAAAVATDSLGDAYVVGDTNSSDFPVTADAFDMTFNGGWDSFVAKIIPVGFFDRSDLMIRSGEVTFLPPSPVVAGATVDVAAVVHNIGGANATDVVVKFYDGTPSPSNQIGLNQTIPEIAYFTAGLAGVQWGAGPPGIHSICVVADPDNLINETDEGNNQACAPIVVQGLPDYTPVNPDPVGTLDVGLSRTASFSISVLNAGGSAPSSTAILALYNASTPSEPFATFALAPIGPSGTSGPFTAVWRSPSTPGTYAVVADVDYANSVNESVETNNTYSWTVRVLGGPNTTLVIGEPSYDSTMTFINSSTPLSFSVVDNSGKGIRRTMYSLDHGAWVNYSATQSIPLAGEGSHVLDWYSEDFIGNIEQASERTLVVDDTPPATVIGCPSVCDRSREYGPDTRFSLIALDPGGSGVNRSEYKIDDGGWTIYTKEFSLPPGRHIISFRSVDNVGNWEPEQSDEFHSKPETNFKPILAGFFVIILIAVGAWSSRRRAAKRGGGERDALRTFVTFSLPFIVAEAVTGVSSALTGQLSAPPWLGLGTALDLGILLAGIAVAVLVVVVKPRAAADLGR